MKPWEKIVHERGQEFLNFIILVNVNFYFAELEIVDLCGKWIPRRSILKEKFWLVDHAADEIRHSEQFKEGVESLGLEWDELDFSKYRISDVSGRFDKMQESDDELEVLVGLNLYAEGVLAIEELLQLDRHASQYFPAFHQILKEEGTHLGYGKEVVRRLIDESSENRERAQGYCDWCREHLQQYHGNDISPIIDKAINFGLMDKNFREKTAERFEIVMSSVGLSVA
jgi:1,2-phenylacetyl-CoA epoxidase catalytic subunit